MLNTVTALVLLKDEEKIDSRLHEEGTHSVHYTFESKTEVQPLVIK